MIKKCTVRTRSVPGTGITQSRIPVPGTDRPRCCQDYSPCFWGSAACFLASRVRLMVSSMMVQAEKDGGIDRGGNSLNVATNFTTSSIAP